MRQSSWHAEQIRPGNLDKYQKLILYIYTTSRHTLCKQTEYPHFIRGQYEVVNAMKSTKIVDLSDGVDM